MALADNIEQFSKLPIQHKALAFGFVAVGLGVIFYFVFYSDLVDQENALIRKIGTLETEKSAFEQKKAEYLSLRNKVAKLEEGQRDLLKVLPTASEIHSLLQTIHAQAELAGLNILNFEQQPEMRERYYARIPVKLNISGTFHQVLRFFYNVGKLKRIVNIQNVSFSFQVNNQLNTKGIKLHANFLASTFRFLAKEAPEGKKKRKGTKG